MLSPEEKTLIRVGLAWSRQDPQALILNFTSDCMSEDLAFQMVMRGRDELAQFARDTFLACPDFKIQGRRPLVAAERAASEWVMTGTHLGVWQGLPPTGLKFSVRGSSVFEFREGLIARQTDYYDKLTLLRQLELVEPDDKG